MKTLGRVGCIALLLVAFISSSAVAWEGRGHGFRPRFHHPGAFFFGFGVGALVTAPFWYPPAYAYPVYAYPSYAPPAAIPPPPPVYWYYCQSPAGYYPYVAQCPGGWLTVVPSASTP